VKTGAVKAFSQLFSIDVKNHSHFGCTAPKALASLDRTLAADEGADLVLLEFGGNDCDFNWAEVSKDPTAKHNPNTPYEEFVETMQSMIRTCRSNGCTPVLMSCRLSIPSLFDWITRPVNVDPEHIMEFLGTRIIYTAIRRDIRGPSCVSPMRICFRWWMSAMHFKPEIFEQAPLRGRNPSDRGGTEAD
jgi:hypothetical protein